MPILRSASAGILTDTRRKPDSIASSKVVSGNADFFSASSLTLTLVADSTDPFVYDIGGVPYVLTASVNLSVTDSAHNFIYVDNTGAMGRSAYPCTYAWTAPSSPSTGEHWYDLGKSQMKSWDGAAWQNVSRIFIGYVRADSGAINARYACEPIGVSPLDRFSFYGDGSMGFLDVSAGTSTKDGWYAYSAVIVRGGTLQHTASTTWITTIQCQGVFIVLSPGTINLDGRGVGGASGGTGTGGSGATGGEGGRGGGGGGGTSAGGAGGSGKVNARTTAGVGGGGGAGGTAGGGTGSAGGNALSSAGPGNASFFIYPQGAPGGGGGGNGTSAGAAGGAAGGAFEIKAPIFAVGSGATVSAKGSNGSNGPAASRGGGGGGGGGTISVWCRNNFQSGTIDVSGGSGGTSGGAGSGAGGNGGTGRSSLFQV